MGLRIRNNVDLLAAQRNDAQHMAKLPTISRVGRGWSRTPTSIKSSSHHNARIRGMAQLDDYTATIDDVLAEIMDVLENIGSMRFRATMAPYKVSLSAVKTRLKDCLSGTAITSENLRAAHSRMRGGSLDRLSPKMFSGIDARALTGRYLPKRVIYRVI